MSRSPLGVGMVVGSAGAAIVFGVGAVIGLMDQSCNIDCYYGDTPPWYVWLPFAAIILLYYAAPPMILVGTLAGGTAALIRRSADQRDAHLAALNRPPRAPASSVSSEERTASMRRTVAALHPAPDDR